MGPHSTIVKNWSHEEPYGLLRSGENFNISRKWKIKLDKGRVLRGGGGGNQAPIEQKLTYFSNHEDDIRC